MAIMFASPPDWVDDPGAYEFPATIAGGIILSVIGVINLQSKRFLHGLHGTKISILMLGWIICGTLEKNQLFVAGYRGSLQEGLKNVKAKTLYLPAETDLLLMPYMAEAPHGILKSQGKNTQLSYLKGALGHLEGEADIKQKAQLLRRFLNDETE